VNRKTLRKGAVWSAEEDAYLLAAYLENESISDISVRLLRSEYALIRRLIRTLLEEKGLQVKSDEHIEYLLEDSPWAESDKLACKTLFLGGFSPVGIAQTLKRKPLSVAAQLITFRDLFR
jgi:hypothetical protein